MTREEIARAVLEAVERGDIPRGGPSEVDARGLADQMPAGYWERWGEDAAERIRAQARCASTRKGESA